VRTINWSITVANDPYFEYNTLLIPGASTTFVDDASTNNFAVTINGDTKPNSLNPYTPGYYSNYFDGTGDYLSVPSSAALNLTGDFTLETWIYPTTINSYNMILGSSGTVNPDYFTIRASSIELGITTNNNYPVWNYSFVTNSWYYVVISRESGALKAFVNGQQLTLSSGSANDSSQIFPSGFANFIGRYAVTAVPHYFTGYISNLRVVKGTAVYTANFTPSTTPLTAIANTSLLTCQSNRFIDNSTNNFTLTVNGNTSISSFDPFVPNSSYSTYGSGYFDGTGDYLSISASSSPVASEDFTIECWYYPVTRATIYGTIYGNFLTYSASGIAIWDRHDSWPTKINVQCGGVNATSTTSVVNNTWYHIAVTRASGTLKLYINGVLEATTASANSSNTPDASFIGRGDTASLAFTYINAYVSDFRIVKGTAVYTTTFTPPSAPLTAIANTSLLVLQNNQSVNNNVFLDNSTNNFFVTRNGNTTQGTFSPYGGNWSNYFDGNADYLTVPTTTALSFGTGDFTVEVWVYKTAAENASVIDARANPGTASPWGFFVDGSNFPYFYNGTVYTSSVAITLNAWNHIAAVREGGGLSIYVNGARGLIVPLTTSLDRTAGAFIGMVANTSSPSSYWRGYLSNLRVVKGTAVYTGSTYTVPTTPLTAIANTSLLTCADNRFIDDSTNNFVITKNGDVSVQRFSPFNPSSVTPTSYSGYFDGTGDYLTVPANTSLALGAGDFTIECWINITGAQTTTYGWGVFGTYDGISNSGWSLTVNRSSGGYGILFIASGAIQQGYTSAYIPTTTWTHLAVVRSGSSTNNLKTYLNGVQVSTSTYTTNDTLAAICYIGSQGTGQQFPGYISNSRLVKGTAVYTGNFTPPTTPLTAITNTSLLTVQSTTFIDNSTNNFTITAVGNSQPTQQNPFGFTSATTTGYTVSTIGGSGYFDGTGDYLSAPNNSAFSFTANFTIEGWFYLTSTASRQDLMGNYATSPLQGFGVALNYLTAGDIMFYYGNSVLATAATGAWTANSWNHFAVVRTSTTITIFVNGVSKATGTLSGTVAPGQVLYIGATGAASGVAQLLITGYMSNVRVVNGTALYTSNFVPPSAPLTAVQNSSLLLNMTSAGIYDAAMMNNMETVADAKLSTAVSKFGGSSMYFDGAGDYLSIPINPSLIFGTGNFTVETWIYLPSVSGHFGVVGMGSSGFFVQISNGNNIHVSQADVVDLADFAISPTLSANTWYHFAMTRSGTSMKAFINGIQQGSTVTNSTNFTGTNAVLVGGHPGGIILYSGYMDDLRITKGYARYTANFTAPTTAFPIY
jgi:hypothetical protein